MIDLCWLYIYMCQQVCVVLLAVAGRSLAAWQLGLLIASVGLIVLISCFVSGYSCLKKVARRHRQKKYRRLENEENNENARRSASNIATDAETSQAGYGNETAERDQERSIDQERNIDQDMEPAAPASHVLIWFDNTDAVEQDCRQGTGNLVDDPASFSLHTMSGMSDNTTGEGHCISQLRR